MATQYLCSYTPLCTNRRGREIARVTGLPPFVDGSCRREPDFESPLPSISVLCRGANFAPRLKTGDRVAYITKQGQYGNGRGWHLVAALRVIERFETHEEAAAGYRARSLSVPSNCLVAGSEPKPWGVTHGIAPPEILKRFDPAAEPERVVRLWDASYRERAKKYGTLLMCEKEFLDLNEPRLLSREDLFAMFGRIPPTLNPPPISPPEYAALLELAKEERR